jgi:hypothetical protein
MVVLWAQLLDVHHVRVLMLVVGERDEFELLLFLVKDGQYRKGGRGETGIREGRGRRARRRGQVSSS